MIHDVIIDILKGYGDNVILVSGACPKGGIDIWAEQIADRLGIVKEIYPPTKPTWYYYKKRNLRISAASDVLFDIEPEYHESGGTWTLMRHLENGKCGAKIEICMPIC